jgi:hypothetical protein
MTREDVAQASLRALQVLAEANFDNDGLGAPVMKSG